MAAKKAKLMICLESPLLKLALRNRRAASDDIFRLRSQYGEFHHLYPQLRRRPEKFFEYTRMSIETFDYLADNLKRVFGKKTTNFQKPITIEERLIITIRYLATGISFRQLAFSFRVGKTTVANIVHSMCKAIWLIFWPKHMPTPSSEYLSKVAQDFWEKWKFPNCCGAIDGKHVRIISPAKSGSMFFNYKKFFSVNLLAVADANYRFSIVNVGAYGKDSDAGVLDSSGWTKAIEEHVVLLPGEKNLPNSAVKAPHVLLGDEGFPLRKYLMRPFPLRGISRQQTTYNKRHSKARRVVECAFGILSAKWRILLKAIETDVQNAENIIKCTTILHNILIDREGINQALAASDVSASSGRPASATRFNSSTREALRTRNIFCEYFNGLGYLIEEDDSTE